MKIAVCDDEKIYLDDICGKLRQISGKHKIESIIFVYMDAQSFLRYYMENRDIDIIFMDILMGEDNGYLVAKKVRMIDPKVKIIFVTSISKYAIKGYEIGVSRYLLKPVLYEKLENIFVNTVTEIYKENSEYLVEKNDDGIFKIFQADIMYIETYGRNTLIHTREQQIVSYRTMKIHQSHLNEHFIRCHAGIIVNLEYIVELKNNEIRLQFGDIVPVSKNRRSGVKESLMKYYSTLLEY